MTETPTLSTDPRRRRLLMGLFAIIGAVLWMLFFLLPQIRTADRLGKELKDLLGQLERTQHDLVQIPSLEKKRALLASQYTVSAPVVPPGEQLPNLLEKITQAARTSHVHVITLKPKQELDQMQIGRSGYLEIPLELLATAGYHQVGRFLDGLEQSGNLVRLRGIEIRPDAKDFSNHQVKILLAAFLVPDPDAASAAAPVRHKKR